MAWVCVLVTVSVVCVCVCVCGRGEGRGWVDSCEQGMTQCNDACLSSWLGSTHILWQGLCY